MLNKKKKKRINKPFTLEMYEIEKAKKRTVEASLQRPERVKYEITLSHK